MAPDDPMNPDVFRALGLLVAFAWSMPCLAAPPGVPPSGAKPPVAGAPVANPGLPGPGSTSMGTNRPAGTARAATASMVEPLSIPLKLSMGAEAVLRQFGTPRSDHRSFGGGLTYPEFRVMFSPKGDEIWSVTLMAPVRLARGLGDGLESIQQRLGRSDAGLEQGVLEELPKIGQFVHGSVWLSVRSATSCTQRSSSRSACSGSCGAMRPASWRGMARRSWATEPSC